jgi:hypothetical protein
MQQTPQRPVPDSRRRTPTIAQPATGAWGAGLVPSQRRAAERRSELRVRDSAQRWLRVLGHR